MAFRPGTAHSPIKIDKASGPDNIPSRLLKELVEELAPCLANIFQSSIDSGQLPEDWRRAKIAPAFKKGNTCQAENHRPISWTCICCKLLEHIVCRHLNDHLDQYHLLSRFQHGFCTRHSCETQLLTTVHDLMQMFDSRKQVDVAVLDFSKAFDTVPHKRLLKKLSHYGIDGPILLWISAFLRDQQQCVVVDGIQSGWSPVKSGVSQGTVLGLLLFLLYINDLPDCVTSQVRLFADDCLIYRLIDTIEDQILLQKDLDALDKWSITCGMKFNPSKCNIISLSRGQSKQLKFYI